MRERRHFIFDSKLLCVLNSLLHTRAWARKAEFECYANHSHCYGVMRMTCVVDVIAIAWRPHLVMFYFSTGRPERRAYIVMGVDDRVHSSKVVVKGIGAFLLHWGSKGVRGTVGSRTRSPCSRCCWEAAVASIVLLAPLQLVRVLLARSSTSRYLSTPYVPTDLLMS